MKSFWTILLTCTLVFSFAQDKKNTLQGVVGDSLSGPLASASVVLLNKEDSLMAGFSITNAEGRFTLMRIAEGDYFLQASYLGYKSYSMPIKVSNNQDYIDMGMILLEPVTSALGEIVLRADRIPIMINKDTIEYNADAFKTQPNDVVEDLLRRLPGIEVESDGTIKAQGEEVQQVLVDGKAFFGKDPQLATKNLAADAIDKVQVFDKKSDIAEFTGIDDGEEEKTINLTLKEDHKKGVFGRVVGGAGTEGRLDTKLNLNKFGKTQQITLLGMSNNVNKQGFSLNDYINFAGGLGNLVRGSSNIQIGGNNNSGVLLADGISDGFVKTGASGINFNQDFGSKIQLNASYFYSNIQNEIVQEVRRESILSERSFLSEENEDELSVNGNHKLNLRFDHQLDSTQNIRFKSSIAFNDSEYSILSRSQVLGTTGELENQGVRDNNSNGNNFNLFSEFLYRKKFQKKGRTISASINFGVQDDDQEVFLESINSFVRPNGGYVQLDSILQNQFQSNDQVNYGFKLTYTEPLGKGRFLGLDYSRKNTSNKLIKDVFDLQNNTEIFNNSLSNHYNRDYIYDKSTTNVRWVRERSNTNIGLSLQHSNLTGELLIDGAIIRKTYTNLLPKITWRYDLSTTKKISLRYTTNVREPSLTQLQPIVDNSNPLNTYVGNPKLRPEYTHRLRLRYMSFSQYTMTNIFAMVNAIYTNNSIVNSRIIDDQFRQTTSHINIDNSYNLTVFTGLGTPLRFLKSRLNFHGNYSFINSSVFINTLEEGTKRHNSSIDLSLDNQNKDILDLRVGVRISQSLTKYALSDNLNQEYINQNYYGNVTINVKESWALNTGLDFKVYSGGTLGSQKSIPIWNASISKYLFNKKGQLEVTAYDLLNKNVGIQQNIDLNYVEDVRINSLAQFFMIKFTYKINQLEEQNAIPRGAIHIRRNRN